MKKFFLLISLLPSLIFASAGKGSPFKWEHRITDDGTLFTLTVSKGNFVYSESIRFTIADADGKTVTPAPRSAPVEKKDESGIVQKIYPAGTWQWHSPGKNIRGEVEFQGCSDDGTCFLPETYSFTASAPVPAAAAETGDAGKYSFVRKAEGYMNRSDFMDFLKGERADAGFGDMGIIGIILLTLLGGLGLNLTPCILPMVPITLIVIGAKGGGKNGLLRGGVYGLGMAIAYGVLGLAAALLGVGFGTVNSMPWFNFVIAGIFIVLALCMVGVFNFNFGSSLRVSPDKLRGPIWVVTFVMGALAALLAGACVAPVVISVLLFVAKEYNSGSHWALLLPFVLGFGMALPWPLAGAGMSVLPKPGRFMQMVKYTLAVVVAAMGIYYLVVGINLLRQRQSAAAETVSDGFAALESAAVRARAEGKPMLIKFGASWCKNCHAMERETLRDPEVAEYIRENFILVDFPAEDPNSPRIKALLQAWNIPGFPAFVIVR